MPQSIRRLLFIDDDAGLRRLAQRALTRRGFDVTIARTSGAEGVAMARDKQYDLDRGRSLHARHGRAGDARTARARCRTRRRSSMSPAREEGRIAVAALKAGAADYVVKTVGEDFFNLLAAALDHVRDRAALERDKARPRNNCATPTRGSRHCCARSITASPIRSSSSPRWSGCSRIRWPIRARGKRSPIPSAGSTRSRKSIAASTRPTMPRAST